MKRESGIYKITLTDQSTIYIGGSQDLYIREKSHLSLLLSDCHTSKKLQSAFNKQERVSYFLFEVLELCPIDILREREQHYIDTFSRTHKLYNVRLSVIPSGEKGKRETQKVDTNLLNKVRQIIAITKQTVGGFIDLAIEEKIKKQKQKQSS